MPFKNIVLKVEDKVATLTLNRPEASNAFANDTFFEVRQALEDCGQDEKVRVVVITGAGRNFSAGGDIKAFRDMVDRRVYLEDWVVTASGKMSIAARRCPKPVIAMVNGAAAGAGCGLALASDFRVVTEKSRFVTAFINIATSGDTGVFYYLAKLIGVGRATEYMMLGEALSGAKAFEFGAATKLVPEEELEAATYQMARRLAEGPGYAYAKQKKMFNEFFYPELDKVIVREAEFMFSCSKTGDFDEALNAFLAKRPPVFKGK